MKLEQLINQLEDTLESAEDENEALQVRIPSSPCHTATFYSQYIIIFIAWYAGASRSLF